MASKVSIQRKLEFPVKKMTRSRAQGSVTKEAVVRISKLSPEQILNKEFLNCSTPRRSSRMSQHQNIPLSSPRKQLKFKDVIQISDNDTDKQDVLQKPDVCSSENGNPSSINSLLLSPSKCNLSPEEKLNRCVTPTLSRITDLCQSRKTETLTKFRKLSATVLQSTELQKVHNVNEQPCCEKSKTTVKESDMLISPRKRQIDSPLKIRPLSPCSPRKTSRKENFPTPVKTPKKHNEQVRQENKSSKLRLFKQNVQDYIKIKQALHTAKPTRLVCREKETKEIETFLQQHLHNHKAGSMYISGAPGTGKTAVLSRLLENYKSKMQKPIFVNCMMMKNSQAIFNNVLTEACGKDVKTRSAKDAQRQLEKLVTSSGHMILLVLDEIDQLDSKNQEVLYTMFEWPALRNSRLVLIGIANALDLTDRVLPRLQARPNCRPRLLNFTPYSKDQIVTILEDRIKQASNNGESVLDPVAVQFCARKVSAVAGDIRKALDVCRRAVEKVESDVKTQQVLKPAVTNSPRKTPQSSLPKKIEVSHIAEVVNEVYGSKVMATPKQQQNIPLQQKLVVCTLLVLLKQGKTKEVTIGKLHETYTKICKKRQVGDSEKSEFNSMCTLLETRGIIGIKKAKEQRLSKVSLKLDEKEVEFALQDKVLITSILQEGLPK